MSTKLLCMIVSSYAENMMYFSMILIMFLISFRYSGTRYAMELLNEKDFMRLSLTCTYHQMSLVPLVDNYVT